MEAYRQQRRKPGPGSIAPAAAGSLEGSPAAGTEAEKPVRLEARKQTKGRRQLPTLEATKQANKQARPAAAGSLEGSPAAEKQQRRPAPVPEARQQERQNKSSNQIYNFRSLQTIEKSPGSDPKRDKKAAGSPARIGGSRKPGSIAGSTAGRRPAAAGSPEG